MAFCTGNFPDFIQSYFFKPHFSFTKACLGDSTYFNFTNHCDYITDFIWEFDDTISGVNDTSTSLEPVHYFASEGTYQVKLITWQGSQIDTLVREVLVSPKPVAILYVSDTVMCFNNNVFVFNDSSTISDNDSLFQTWYLGADTLYNFQSIGYNFKSPGTLYPKLEINSKAGCSDVDSVKIVIHPSPVPDFSINNDFQCLNTNQFIFKNNSTIEYGNIDSVFWDLGDSTFVINNDSIAKSYISEGGYIISLSVKSDENCADAISKNISINPSPNADFIIHDSIQCVNSNFFEFEDKTVISYGNIFCTWKFGDGKSGTGTSVSNTYAKDDTFIVEMIAKSNLGCSDTAIKTVLTVPEPTAYFTIDKTIQCLNNNEVNFNNQSSIAYGKLNYTWNFGDRDTSNTESPKHSYLFADTFTTKLTAESEFGCTDSFNWAIVIRPLPEVDFFHQ
jgi:PKD repeat protein